MTCPRVILSQGPEIRISPLPTQGRLFYASNSPVAKAAPGKTRTSTAGWSNTLTGTEGVPIERQTRLIMSALSCAGLRPTRVMLLSPATIRLSLPCWLVALRTAAVEANSDLENTN